MNEVFAKHVQQKGVHMKSYGERKVQKLQLYLSSNVCMFQYDMFTKIKN